MKNKDVFWDFFMATGNVGAYLISHELNKKGRELKYKRKKTSDY